MMPTTRRGFTSTLDSARRAPRPTSPTPPPIYSQAEQRERRRKHLPVTYDGTFDLTAEVAALLDPLAERIAADPHPTGHAVAVEDVTDAVASTVRAIARLLAELDARQRCAGVPIEQRGRAIAALIQLADMPGDPEVTDDDLGSGEWASALTRHAALYSVQLADRLGRALPPGQTRGALSVSELVEAELRAIDSAATLLSRRIAASERQRAQTSTRKADTRTEAEQARATLADLGIDA